MVQGTQKDPIEIETVVVSRRRLPMFRTSQFTWDGSVGRARLSDLTGGRPFMKRLHNPKNVATIMSNTQDVLGFVLFRPIPTGHRLNSMELKVTELDPSGKVVSWTFDDRDTGTVVKVFNE